MLFFIIEFLIILRLFDIFNKKIMQVPEVGGKIVPSRNGSRSELGKKAESVGVNAIA